MAARRLRIVPASLLRASPDRNPPRVSARAVVRESRRWSANRPDGSLGATSPGVACRLSQRVRPSFSTRVCRRGRCARGRCVRSPLGRVRGSTGGSQVATVSRRLCTPARVLVTAPLAEHAQRARSASRIEISRVCVGAGEGGSGRLPRVRESTGWGSRPGATLESREAVLEPRCRHCPAARRPLRR